jgi:PAS domain S-box-containing protein
MGNSPEKNILIVEDESVVAIDLRQSLHRMGYGVTDTVQSGEDALESVKSNPPGLILMDIGLKGNMDGIEAAGIIHKEYGLPIIFLTAYADDDTLRQATETGPYGYLVKPYQERELKTSIEVALSKCKIEHELIESREQFREIFEQNADAIVLFRRSNFEIIDMNPAAVSIFQYPKQQLVEDFSLVFENTEMHQMFKKEVSHFHQKGDEIFSDRCHLRRKDGYTITCSIQVNLIKLQQIEVLYCVFRDITEAVEIEEESRRLQNKLIQANRMTSIGTLASGLAHEINNPNNFIMSNTQIIQQVWDDLQVFMEEKYHRDGNFQVGGIEYSEAVSTIPQLLKDTIEGSRRIKNITDTLKEYSRPKDSQVYARININNVLRFSINILNNQITKYTDAFSFNPGDDIPVFKGNPQQIEQVVINLIQNSLHALPDKTHGIQVHSSFDPTGNRVVVTVADEGVGMNRKVLDRITEPFFTTKQDMDGTGLGLYISYSIVKAHKGVIEFESLPGKGTTATIKIPINDAL